MLGPFQVLKPPITLRPKQPPGTGPDTATPIAWWRFDEESGLSAANAVGTQLTARLKGEPRWAPGQGRLQGALELDGVNDWIECADSTDLAIRDGLSVSLWIKTGKLPSADDTIIAKGDAWGLRRLVSGELEFNITGPQPPNATESNLSKVGSKQALNDNQWHHVAAVYDGKRIALYLDGLEKDSTKASGPIALNNLPLTFGDNAANRGALWSGSLDDVRLFDLALSAGEISGLHRGGL